MVSLSNHRLTSIRVHLRRDVVERENQILVQQKFDSADLSRAEAQARKLHSAKRVPEAVAVLRRVLAARLEFQG